MSNKYILDGHDVIHTTDLMEWAIAFEKERHVADDTIYGVRISTSFLGIDHGFMGKPLLFETMVFGGELDGEVRLYATWEEAEVGHKQMVKEVELEADNE